MRRARFLKPVPEGAAADNPPRAIYHVVSRVVDRRFVLNSEEKHQFRVYLRMYERFSGCRVLSYCLMTNHFHLLLEVPPALEGAKDAQGEDGKLALSDKELLWRLGGLYSEGYLREVTAELKEAREKASGKRETVRGEERLTEEEREQNRKYWAKRVEEIHERYYYRMHSLSEFMKGLLQRFSQWFNRTHGRKGVLWEDRFKSVIVEGGMACRTMAAYIDLNPVRAGMVEDPADYRWSSYGEAVGGGKGAKRAREGLIRALHGHRLETGKEGEIEEERLPTWSGRRSRKSEVEKVEDGTGARHPSHVAKEYRRLLMSAGVEQPDGGTGGRKKGLKREVVEAELKRLEEERARDLKISKVVRCRIRYFTDGAVIGSRAFVNEVFEGARDRFGSKRKDGARKPRGVLKDLAGELWSLRDLQSGERNGNVNR